MPKMKSHRGAKKRFHVTGTGKLMQMKGHRGHNRSKKQRRQLDAMLDMHPVPVSGQQRRLRRLLPYGA